MSSETLTVSHRKETGTNASKRLRATGQIPAILYGHGQENVNLAIRSEAINNLIKHGTKLVSLAGDISDMAVLRQVHWNTYGTDVLHVDLFRVSATEAVEVTLPVHLHGEAPGVGEGGNLVFQTHELTILCPASSIPEYITVYISQLHLGQSIHASEVLLPEGAAMVTTPSRVVVQVAKHVEVSDEELLGGGAAEPELVRKEKAKGEE